MEDIKRFETTLTNFSDVNNGFIRATVNIFTKDQVANGFEFQDECIEKRRKQWAYVPVVAEYIEDDEDMGSHGGKLTISDGDFKYERTTIPMGVAIADTDRFEDVVCMNGEKKRYFCTDVYLWYEQFEKELSMFKNGESRPQSMEVKILKSSFIDGVEKVYDFEPLAICILGQNVPPAYKDSKIKVSFQSDEFKANFDKMMFALDKYIKLNEKGGVEMEEEYKKNEEGFTEETDTKNENTEETNTDESFSEEVSEMKENHEEVEEKSKYENVEEVNYEEKFNEIQLSFNKLKNELETLQSKYDDVNEKYQEYIKKEEEHEKQEVLNSFSEKLTQDEITRCVDDISKFTVEEIETRLTLELGRKAKLEKQDATFAKSSQDTNEFMNFAKFDDNSYFAQLAKKIKRNQ